MAMKHIKSIRIKIHEPDKISELESDLKTLYRVVNKYKHHMMKKGISLDQFYLITGVEEGIKAATELVHLHNK